MRKRLVAILLISWPFHHVAAQNALSLKDIQIVNSLFDQQFETIVSHSQTNGWGNFENNLGKQTEFKALANNISTLLTQAADKQFPETGMSELRSQLLTFNLFVDEIYGAAEKVPVEIISKPFRIPINRKFRKVLQENIREYYRKFFIKYGKRSERLNILEILFNNWVFSPKPQGSGIAPPYSWEPILRMSVLGYQFYIDDRKFVPSSPIYQLGLTKYLFARNSFSKWVNHIGLAGAFQYDLAFKRRLWGGVLHIRTFDIALFIAEKTDDFVIAASFNFQIIKKFF